jgi:dTDP-4-dehydrorhamnose 3,5-epimerase
VQLPDGVRIRVLDPHRDDRGVFTELFREEWGVGVSPVQWNAVTSEPDVLRGVHVHPVHDDYLVVFAGRASVGLSDLRRDSATHGAASLVELDGRAPRAITIPHGVAHGFWFHDAATHIYAVSHVWDTADELGCRWDDPDLGIPWPDGRPRLSPRDAALPPLAVLAGQLGAALTPAGWGSPPSA